LCDSLTSAAKAGGEYRLYRSAESAAPPKNNSNTDFIRRLPGERRRGDNCRGRVWDRPLFSEPKASERRRQPVESPTTFASYGTLTSLKSLPAAPVFLTWRRCLRTGRWSARS